MSDDNMTATEKVQLRVQALEALKAALARGMDAREIARGIDKEAEAIGRYIGGENLPTVKTARKILKVCAV